MGILFKLPQQGGIIEDPVVPSVVATLSDEDWSLPYVQPNTANPRACQQSFFVDDDAWPLGGFRLDDEYWRADQRIQLVRNLQPTILDEDLRIPAAVDEDYWYAEQRIRLVQNVQPIRDNDESEPLGGFRVDEDYWTFNIQRLPSSRLVWLDADDYWPLGGLRLDDDTYFWRPPLILPLPRAHVLLGDDSLSALGDDDSFWITPLPQRIPLVNKPALLDTDEWVQQAATLGIDDDPWPAKQQIELLRNRQPLTDTDESEPLGGFRLEDEGQFFQQATSVTNIQPVIFDDELRTQAVIDEDEWARPRQQQFPIAQQPWFEGDELTPLGGFRLDEDYWYTNTQALPFSRLVWTDVEEYWPLGGFRLDEDYWLAGQRISIVQNRQPITDTDESAPLGGFRLADDDDWKPVYLPFMVNRQPVYEQDELGTPVTTAIEEDYWFLAQPQSSASRGHVFIGDDSLTPLAEMDDWLASQLIRLLYNVQTRLVDDERPTPPTTAIDEDEWLAIHLIRLVRNIQPFLDTDEGAPLGGFRLDADDWLSLGLPQYRANRQPSLDTDEWVPGAAAFGLDDDPWPANQRIGLVRNAQPATDNDEAAPLGGFRLDEDYWFTNLQRLPFSRLVWTDREDYWPLIIPTIVPPGGSLEGCHILSGVAAEGCGIQTAGSTECDDMQSGPAREV